MSDLASMMKYAPTTAGGFMGINQDNQEILDVLKQAEFQALANSRNQETAFKADMHPLEMEAKRLANQQGQAQLPGMVADAELKALKAKMGNATFDADSEEAVTEKKMKVYKLVGSHLGGVADAIESNPSAPPHAVLAAELQRRGVPEKVQQQFLQRYSGVEAPTLSKTLREHGDRMLRENEKYAQAYDESAMSNDRAILTNAATNATNLAIADKNIAAGKFNKSSGKAAATVEDSIRSSKKASERHQKLIDAAKEAEQDGNEALAASYRARAAEIRPQAEAELAAANQMKPGSVDTQTLTGGAVPTNPSRSIAPPGAPAMPAAGPQGDIAAGAQKAWGSYEPNKYDYRIGPNGQLQRKAK